MRFLCFLIITLFMLYGCSAVTTFKGPAIDPAFEAKQLLHTGQFAVAAEEYIQLSQQYPARMVEYQLMAANALIEDGRPEAAIQLINDTQINSGNSQQLSQKNIILAKLALFQSNVIKALNLLEEISNSHELPDEFILIYHGLRASLFNKQMAYLQATKERLEMQGYIQDASEKLENLQLIWRNLNKIDAQEMIELEITSQSDLNPWIELAVINKTLASKPEELKNAVGAWQDYYPRHPANLSIVSQILEMTMVSSFKPQQIALLLPLTGGFERYSERIRDGFLAAWFVEKEYKPKVRIYNANSLNINTIYDKAVEEGADFIVGPLEKKAVRSLYDRGTLPVRTLALNQIEKDDFVNSDYQLLSPARLIQFGLLPEDEARQVAERGIFEGHNRVLIITPADELGNRIFNAFNNVWEKMGGIVLERVNYDPSSKDFIAPVKSLLNIESSEYRINALKQKIGRNMNSVSRVREDADFIFMVANNLPANQLVPQLRFFRAGELPIYSISHIYRGKPNPQSDSDLNGVELVDIPWVLQPTEKQDDIQLLINSRWKSQSTTFPRYYAFGVDSFRIITNLGKMAADRTNRYTGATGELFMTDDGVIHRNLLWAKFINGEPKIIDIGNTF